MYIVVFVTTKNGREANKISTKLIEGKLIACANIIKGVHSIFRWKGKIDQAAGVVNILVGFAPLRPAEFVVVKLSQKTRQQN